MRLAACMALEAVLVPTLLLAHLTVPAQPLQTFLRRVLAGVWDAVVQHDSGIRTDLSWLFKYLVDPTSARGMVVQ